MSKRARFSPRVFRDFGLSPKSLSSLDTPKTFDMPLLLGEIEKRPEESEEEYALRIEDIPPDVLLLIIRFLNVKDASRLCRTSSFWYGLCQEEQVQKIINKNALEIDDWCGFNKYVEKYGFYGSKLGEELERRNPLIPVLRDAGLPSSVFDTISKYGDTFVLRYNVKTESGTIIVPKRGKLPHMFTSTLTSFRLEFQMQHPELLLDLIEQMKKGDVSLNSRLGNSSIRTITIQYKQAVLNFENSVISKIIHFKCLLV